jgi:hypothetical protein
MFATTHGQGPKSGSSVARFFLADSKWLQAWKLVESVAHMPERLLHPDAMLATA